jgi:hypothetical protein
MSTAASTSYAMPGPGRGAGPRARPVLLASFVVATGPGGAVLLRETTDVGFGPVDSMRRCRAADLDAQGQQAVAAAIAARGPAGPLQGEGSSTWVAL